VKFVKVDGDNFVFHLGRREKNLLLDVLRMYPLIPISHHRISRSSDSSATEANQKLLEDALAEHRSENKKALEAMLNEPNRFQETPSGYRLSLTAYHMEWMLQVLNDVRVGSWLRLGSPDEKQGKRAGLHLQNARYHWAMELSGHFEYALLAGRGPI
jgi:hypothetical protein